MTAAPCDRFECPEELAISSNSESAARGELIGVGAAFGVTVTVISLVAGQGLALALIMGSGGGLMYALGWRLHRSSQQRLWLALPHDARWRT